MFVKDIWVAMFGYEMSPKPHLPKAQSPQQFLGRTDGLIVWWYYREVVRRRAGHMKT